MTLTIAERRIEVSRLTADGMAARAVARHLGVSKDTVIRDMKALDLVSRDSGTPGQLTLGAELDAASVSHDTGETPGTPVRPSRATMRHLRHRTRPTRRTVARRPTAEPTTRPPVIEVPVDDWVAKALAWCATAGHPDPVDAIEWALGEAAARIHAERAARRATGATGGQDDQHLSPSA